MVTRYSTARHPIPAPLILMLVSILLAVVSVNAQADSLASSPILTEESTLADYLGYAALHNQGLKAAFEKWQAAVNRISPAGALPDPRITFSHYIEEVETRVGPQRRSFALSQKFPWMGKLKSRRDAAARAADAALQQFEATRLDVYYRVKHAFYEYYFIARAVEVTEENVQLLTYLEEVTLTAYASGAGSHGNAIKAQIALGKTDDLLQSLFEKRVSVRARLNAVLNRPPKTDLPRPSAISADERESDFTDDQVLTWLAESPRLKAAGFAAESNKARWSEAKKQWFPDLMLGVKVIDTDPALMSGVEDSGKDPVVATFSVNIPLWWGKYRAVTREKKARYQAALYRRTDLNDKLSALAVSAMSAYRDAQRRIELYEQSLLPKAEQHFEVTQQAFTSGSASFLDLIDAQRTQLEFQLALERARVDRWQKQAELEKLIGRELP